jgi:hypothetical protein
MWVRYNETWYGEGAAGGTVISLKCCSSSERTTPDSSGGDKHSTYTLHCTALHRTAACATTWRLDCECNYFVLGSNKLKLMRGSTLAGNNWTVGWLVCQMVCKMDSAKVDTQPRDSLLCRPSF